MIIQTLIDSILQLVLFSAIPFIWWLATARKRFSFLVWIGLCAPKFENNKKTWLLIIGILVALVAPGMGLIYAFEDKSVLANTKYVDTGFQGFVSILLFAIIQTGLAEEILFRGFLNKRLSNRFSFAIGNAVQAVLFGLLHGVALFGAVSAPIAIAAVAFTSTAGWLMGYLNERCSGGSIIPSWMIHSFVNILSSLIFLFGLIHI